MTADQSRLPDRIKGAIAAVIVQLALGYILIAGLAVHSSVRLSDDLKLFGIAPSPPPPPPEKKVPHRKTSRAEGAASPPNLRAKPTEVVAPRPVVVTTVPPPVVAAPIAGPGAQASAGAADVRGPGTGAGGVGNGTGSGGYGDGDGDGGYESPPRRRSGRLKDSDYPGAVGAAGIGGTVSVRYTVETNGRATGCFITHSSGNELLDVTTCRLIEQRFRFEPSRDARGRPVRSVLVEDHVWEIDQQPAPEEPRR
ncbi:energy transducer TonB [Sphingomonas sp.]|uniref:energy transducer TonB n=1 Tax=Sphingomonas sp. TaxID=28214 RepID=UPI003D6CBAE2